jgi:hypothetical protein
MPDGACCPAFDFDVLIWGWGSDADPTCCWAMTAEQIPTSSESGYPILSMTAVRATGCRADRKAPPDGLEMQEIAHNDVVYIVPYYEKKFKLTAPIV